MPVYECENCGKRKDMAEQGDAAVPECCGKPMRGAEKLPVCELSSTAEHSRPGESEDACDDGRAGN